MAEESAETVTTSLRIPGNLLDAIRTLAEADDRSVNYLLVRAVREYVDQHATGKGKRKE